MKFNNYIFKTITVFIISLLTTNCSNEIEGDSQFIDQLLQQKEGLETVPLENTLDFFKTINTTNKLNKNSIDLEIDLETLDQIDLTDTDAKLNIANATTKYNNVQTQVLQIEIDGELQTVLFHQIPENNSSKTGNSGKTSNAEFSGSVYSTDLSGAVLSGFSIDNGNILGTFNFLTSSYSTGSNPCWGIGCGITLDEVVVTNSPTTSNSWTYGSYNNGTFNNNYQWSRSLNNYSSMGVAYDSYYRGKAIKEFDDKIQTKDLKPCLKTILDKLKSVKGSPGNMVAKFSGKYPGYNWNVQSGSLSGPTAQTDPPTEYNSKTGSITTVFDSQAYLNATDLSWARTIIHESIHAYLASYFKISRPNWIATYPEMVEDWGAKQNWNDVHHEEIAKSLVKDVAVALESYGIMNKYDLTKQFYEDMAWAGLQETTTFKKLSTADKKRILDTIATELTGNDTDGNEKKQKGKNAGC